MFTHVTDCFYVGGRTLHALIDSGGGADGDGMEAMEARSVRAVRGDGRETRRRLLTLVGPRILRRHNRRARGPKSEESKCAT